MHVCGGGGVFILGFPSNPGGWLIPAHFNMIEQIENAPPPPFSLFVDLIYKV